MLPIPVGFVAGALAVAGSLSTSAGYPVLAAFLTDPSTAQTATLWGTAVAAGVAAVSKGYGAWKADRAAKRAAKAA